MEILSEGDHGERSHVDDVAVVGLAVVAGVLDDGVEGPVQPVLVDLLAQPVECLDRRHMVRGVGRVEPEGDREVVAAGADGELVEVVPVEEGLAV